MKYQVLGGTTPLPNQNIPRKERKILRTPDEEYYTINTNRELLLLNYNGNSNSNLFHPNAVAVNPRPKWRR
jgi:hypothetical protein